MVVVYHAFLSIFVFWLIAGRTTWMLGTNTSNTDGNKFRMWRGFGDDLAASDRTRCVTVTY